MSDLVGFLRARLDEDEAVARAAAPGPWGVDDDGCCVATDELGIIAETHAGMPLLPQTATVTHIARWDPARVLAEVAAKQCRLELLIAIRAEDEAEAEDYSEWAAGRRGHTHPPARTTDSRLRLGLEWVVRMDAQTYAGHPDFDPAWRTDG